MDKEKILDLLTDRLFGDVNVSLNGAGEFINGNGYQVSPFAVLQSLYEKHLAINQAICYIKNVKTIDDPEFLEDGGPNE